MNPDQLEREADAVRYLLAALKLFAVVLGVFLLLVGGLVAAAAWLLTT